jgi:tripartite-type tricarboxylate transporter receptor subunit TctC
LLGDVAPTRLIRSCPYDPQKDFSPVSLTGRFAVGLLVNTTKLKVGSPAELVEAARKAPYSIDYEAAASVIHFTSLGAFRTGRQDPVMA